MNISLARYLYDTKYNKNAGIFAIIDGKEMSIPIDPANTDYQAIQEWVAEGNTIEDAD
tara:strand:- start:42 stop:215 length:174 start_codon:yes stop_codon:yes gene_type:complete